MPAMSLSSLGLGDFNIVVTTDVHSWLDGHVHADQPYGQLARTDATFGDVVALLGHLRTAASARGRDVFFFDNGDVVDGTGLSSATPVAGSAVFPLLGAMPYDAMNLGNHELYNSQTVERDLLGSGFIAARNGSYLTSNVDLAATGQAVGARYTVREGRHGTRLLVFGFLFDMEVRTYPYSKLTAVTTRLPVRTNPVSPPPSHRPATPQRNTCGEAHYTPPLTIYAYMYLCIEQLYIYI